MTGVLARRFSRYFTARILSVRPSSSGLASGGSRCCSSTDGSGARACGDGKSDAASRGHDDEEVTEEELKRRIQKFYDGDAEALPLIFEAILRRKLAGKNDEGLIEQLPISSRRDDTESGEERD